MLEDLTKNSLGRAYSLWLLCRRLGLEAQVVGPASGGLWTPLLHSEFARSCRIVSAPSDAAMRAEVEDAARWSDALVAVKPLVGSFGLAMDISAKLGRRFVLDVDDPDLEVRLQRYWGDFRLGLRKIRPLRIEETRAASQLMRAARRHRPLTVSNPVLQKLYRGLLVPHVRQPRPVRRPSNDGIVVAFVGTPRRHKGVDLLRGVVADLADKGFRLVFTADPPADAQPWERWVGETPIEAGLDLLDEADIAAIPSDTTPYGRAQLPVKLIDAMLAAKPVVASRVPPIAWALGNTGMLVRPTAKDELMRALLLLSDADRRRQLGSAARERALGMFTPEPVAPSWLGALNSAASPA